MSRRFVESEHKRDERGRFAEMETSVLKKQQMIELDDSQMPTPETAYGFANKERKNTKHHREHAKEMGFKNQDDYEREACRFFNSSEGMLYYSERRDRFYRYDEKKGRYVTSSYGIVHTFMNITKKEFARKIKEDGLVWTM